MPAGWEVHVCLRWGGPLRSEFEAAAASLILEPLHRVRAAARRVRRLRRLADRLDEVGALLGIIWKRPDLIWCNTVLSSCYIRPAVLLRRPVVLHAHEPLDRMRQVFARYKLEGKWSRACLVGCAPAVCDDLAAATGRRREDVHCLPSVPDERRVHQLAGDGERVDPERLTVGACGTPNQTKGIDLWLQIAERVSRSASQMDVQFVWIGGPAPREIDDATLPGAGRGRIHFTGMLDNPYAWLRSLDVFVLTSRVDPFPLVVLEAMSLGRPVVGFQVGDVAYQLGGNDHLHPVGAVDAVANDVVELLCNPEERLRFGEALAGRATSAFGIDRFRQSASEIATLATKGES